MAFLLHHLLSESAAKYPERDAIICKDRAISYRELERQSNKLAHRLITLGVAQGDRIGLYFDRGIESIVAACGVLKAGASYVPIDPMSPLRRFSYIIEKCQVKTLICLHEKLMKIETAFPEKCSLERIVLMNGTDTEAGAPSTMTVVSGLSVAEQFGDSAPDVGSIDSDIAYILFTSGSTGNPKGVMISHLNALTFVNSTCEFFHVEKEDRLSNIAPLHFDMSIFDVFVAFKAGACVVSIPEAVAMFPVKLAQYISEKKISVWNSVPSALSLLATYKALDTCDLSSMRLILFAGELFPLKYLRLLQKTIPGARFCNMYGQTEANSSTYYWVEQLPTDDTEKLPIGRALPNFEVFALDEQGNRVQRAGDEGEFYVRASTVAWGYWGEAERTQKAFVNNPLHPNMAERVYKTGDLVRLNSDGNYVFIGRKDHMIKSRGYRIEIGEVETVLCNHPEITNAVVLPIPDELIGNRLTAIVVSSSPGKISQDDVLRYCLSQLPKYMIPETIEFRDSLPMTSSGKLDRMKLRSS